jgi:hypothetical protein
LRRYKSNQTGSGLIHSIVKEQVLPGQLEGLRTNANTTEQDASRQILFSEIFCRKTSCQGSIIYESHRSHPISRQNSTPFLRRKSLTLLCPLSFKQRRACNLQPIPDRENLSGSSQ